LFGLGEKNSTFPSLIPKKVFIYRAKQQNKKAIISTSPPLSTLLNQLWRGGVVPIRPYKSNHPISHIPNEPIFHKQFSKKRKGQKRKEH